MVLMPRMDYQNPIRLFRDTEREAHAARSWLRENLGEDRFACGLSYTGSGRWMLVAWFAHPADRTWASLVLL